MSVAETLSEAEFCIAINNALYLESPIDGGCRVINFGIDNEGREFVLIHNAVTNKGHMIRL